MAMRQRIPCTRRGRRCAPVRLNHLLNQRDVWCVLWEVRIGAEDCDERCPHHPARHVLVCRSIRLPLHGGGADPTTPWHVIAGATRSPSHGGAVLLIMEITFACIGGAAVRQRALAYATSVVVFGWPSRQRTVSLPCADGWIHRCACASVGAGPNHVVCSTTAAFADGTHADSRGAQCKSTLKPATLTAGGVAHRLAATAPWWRARRTRRPACPSTPTRS